MLNRGGCLGIARRAAHAGTTFAVVAATGGGLIALWPALPASAAGTGADSVAVVSSTGGSSTFGDQVTFTATVTPGAGGPATGSITFSFTNSFNGTTVFNPICAESGNSTVPLNGSGIASCTPTHALLAGTDVVTAAYGGDATFMGNSNTVAQNVAPRDTTTALTDNGPKPSTYGQSVSLAATIAPVASLIPQAAVVPAPGNNLNFNANAITLADCTNQSVVQVGVTTTATSSCHSVDLPTGSDSLAAHYNGDGNYNPSLSPSVAHTVNKIATSVSTPTSTSNPVRVNQSVTYTTTLTPASTGASLPTGTVSFSDHGTAIPACSGGSAPQIAGNPLQASCTITYGSVGQHSITAIYNGDTNYGVSPASGALSQGVVANGSTTTVTADGPNPSTYGQTVTFTATVSGSAGPPTGMVAFASGGNALCTNSVSTSGVVTTATCSTNVLPGGTDQVTASYLGDSNYAASQGQVNQTVTKVSTTTAVTASPNPSNIGQQVTYTAKVTPATMAPSGATGTIGFTDGGTQISGCAAQPIVNWQATCTVTYASGGKHSIVASYSGDGNYASSASPAINQNVALPGYQMVASDGGLFNFGPLATFYGSTGGSHLNAPIVGMARDSATGGYWLVGADGGVFSFHAPFYGSMGSVHLNKPIVGIVAAPGGTGYWLVASDGGVFAFGPGAHFYGSMGSAHLNRPIVGIAAAPGGNGYWLVGSDGGVFTFGPGAIFYGSEGATHLNQPVVGIAAASGGNGYWLVAADGGVFAFGPSATFYGSEGSAHLNRPIVGIAPAPGGTGYWLVGSDGGLFTFGPTASFYGSLGGQPLNGPVVGIAGVG